jgi:dTDP-4-dehydrorhamnose reductase
LALQIARVIDSDARGVYHATAEGYCVWYDLARHFLQAMRVPFDLAPCTTADYPTPARRPANSILENSRLKSENLNVMADWRSDVDEFVHKHRDQLLAEVL